MKYERPQKTPEELEAEAIIKQQMLREADAHAKERIKQAEASAAERSEALRGEALQEVQPPDSSGE